MMAKARDEGDAAFDAYFYWLCDGSMSFGNMAGEGGGGGGIGRSGSGGASENWVGEYLYESDVRFYGYSYNWSTGQYTGRYTGNLASYDEVYHNYIVPNSTYSFSGDAAKSFVSVVQGYSLLRNNSQLTASVNQFLGGLNPWKMLIPVAFVMDINFEILGMGVAGIMVPIGAGIVLQGINKGQTFLYGSGGLGFGILASISASANSVYFFYFGNTQRFEPKMLAGPSTVLNLSLPAGENWGFGRSIILQHDNYGNVILGIGTSVGVGGSLPQGYGSVSVTFPNTQIYTH